MNTGMSSPAKCIFDGPLQPALILPAGGKPIVFADILILQEQADPPARRDTPAPAHRPGTSSPAGLINAAADWTVSQYMGPTCSPEPSRFQPQAPVDRPRT